MSEAGPRAATDVIVELETGKIVLIERKNPPHGWALPGGFIEVGEKAEEAAVRECAEEIGLEVELAELFHVYSDPVRDPRQHTLSVVFIGRARGTPMHGDDAAAAGSFAEELLPTPLAFDHATILDDYFRYRRTGERPEPRPRGMSPFTPAERELLLQLAREAIASRVSDTASERSPAGARLEEPRGVFVSLHAGEELRGCIGTLAADRPLVQAVEEMAQAAAFEDPRFPPLSPEELSGLRIEISVLSPLRRAPAEAVIPGVHGVSISRSGQKAVFLPQVAREIGWTRQDLLSQTCLKAGLPADAWTDPATEIFVFTAEIFGE
jgi:AmmeMemoRadiSam system protein A